LVEWDFDNMQNAGMDDSDAPLSFSDDSEGSGGGALKVPPGEGGENKEVGNEE
jgi:hypothetical protein